MNDVKVETKIQPEESWNHLDKGPLAQLSKKVCTLEKGKVLSPSMAKKFEKYVFLGPATKIKSDPDRQMEGKPFDFLVPIGEGQCLVEQSGEYASIDCTGALYTSPREVEQPSEEGLQLPPFDSYVYTQCAEGHWTWIPQSTLDRYPDHIEFSMGPM